MISDFWFRFFISDFWFQILNFRFCISDFWFLIVDFRFFISDFLFQILDFRFGFLISEDFLFQITEFRFWIFISADGRFFISDFSGFKKFNFRFWIIFYFRFWKTFISDLKFLISVFRCQIFYFSEFQISDFTLLVLDFRFWIKNLGFKIFDWRFQP